MGRLLKNNIKQRGGRPKTAHPYKDILAGRPWKNTEKTLKRCGMSFFNPDSTENSENGMFIISYMEVIELYRLHYIANLMRLKGMPVELFKLPEVYQNAQTKKSDGSNLSHKIRWKDGDVFISPVFNYIIVPTHIRRTVSGRMDFSENKRKQSFDGGLYRYLSSVYAETLVTELMKRIQIINNKGSFNLLFNPNRKYPVTTLFTFENKRLSILGPLIVFEAIKKVNDVCLGETLATALYFSLLNYDVEDIENVRRFIKKEQYSRNKDERINNARRFIDKINRKYPFLLK